MPVSVFMGLVGCLLLLGCAVSSVLSDCPVGQFGPSCNGTCHCLDNELCDPDSGHCNTGKCEKGYYKPPVCQEECPDGMYGIDCEETCHCMNDSFCDKKSGTCPQNICHPDWYSYACSKRLPKLVSSPAVSLATCTYLTVTWPVWNADTDFGDLDVPVAEYRLYQQKVHVNSSASGVWQQVVTLTASQNTSAKQYSYNVTGLLPDQYYVFRVDVHGSNDGKVVEKVSRGVVSDPPTVVPCTTTTVPPPVTIPIIVGTEIFDAMTSVKEGNSSLLITWSIDPDLRRFSWNITLSYQLIGIGDCSPLSNEAIVSVPVSQAVTEYRLVQLDIWSRYKVTLRARGTGIISYANGTEVITAVTGEVKPLGRVSQVRVSDVQATSVRLAWNPVPCAERGGVLLRYDIIIASPGTQRRLQSNVTSLTVTPLTPFSNYTAQVRYVNSAGEGAYSDALPFSTAEGVPAAVKITSLVPSTITVVVNFDPPVPANGRLLEYYVFYSTSPSFTSPVSLTVNASLPDAPVIRRLTPDTVYYVQVRASTSAGYGKYGSAVQTRTLPVRPFPPSSLVQSAVNATCLSLTWLPPDQTSVTITGYKVTIRKDSDGTSNTTLHPATATSYTHCGLDSSSSYTVSVASQSVGGSGEAASIQVITEQADPPKPSPPTLIRLTPTTAVLQIRPVSIKPGPVIFYQIEVERLGGGGGDGDSGNSTGRRRKRLAEVPGYVTAQLTPENVQKNSVFVVGDGKNYSGYSNLPLQPGQAYQVYYVLISQWNGVTKFALSSLANPFSTPLPTTTTLPTTTIVTNATTTAEAVSPEDDNGGFIGVIVALVLVILLIVVVIIVILWWRRRQRSLNSAYIELGEEMKTKPSAEVYDPERYWNQVTSLGEGRYIVVGRECLPDEQLFPAGTQRPLPSSALVTFHKEFQSLPHTVDQATTAEALEHPDRNRFPHILAYDHSRVALSPDASSSCVYINANFLSGYKMARAYIAAQSPYNDVTAVDFWRLIHQQEVRTVVMLANVMEDNIIKCTQFWPRQGKVTIGEFYLELREEAAYADFTLYDIGVSESGEDYERTVRLFDFTAWPNHGVPDDPLPFLDLRHKVRQYHGGDSSPILVHCGTGVARSGVFIAVDSLIDQYAEEGRISVFSFVRKMRAERPLMVRTYKQYAFIYECLLEHFQAGQVLTHPTTLKDMYHQWTNTNKKTGNSFLKDQFQLLQRLTRAPDVQQCSAAFLPPNVPKNRYPDIVPSDQHRPPLLPLGTQFSGDYINAVYVDGYRTQNQFLVTQSPLHNTLADFWRLVYQLRVTTLVTMDNYNQQDMASLHYWAPDVTGKPWGPFWIHVTSAFQQENITVHEIKLVNTLYPEEEPHTVRQFQFNGWAEKSLTPVSKTMALDLLDQVLDFHRSSSNPDSPIVVHCEDGATHSGLLVSLAVVCERMEEEHEVDVYHVIKHIKRRRPQILQDYDQYRFCYKALWDFFNLRMPGGPYTDTLGQTKSDKVYGVASLSLTSHHDSLY